MFALFYKTGKAFRHAMTHAIMKEGLLTKSEIARQLGRSAQGVFYALKRLGVAHAGMRGAREVYHPAVVAQLRKSMRGKNKSQLTPS